MFCKNNAFFCLEMGPEMKVKIECEHLIDCMCSTHSHHVV